MNLISDFFSVAENTDNELDYLSEMLCTPIDESNNKIFRDSMHREGSEDDILSELN